MKVLLKQSKIQGIDKAVDFANDGQEAVDLVLKRIELA